MKKIRKVAVLAGVWESEREISFRTASAVCASLIRLGYEAKIIDIGRGKKAEKIQDFSPDFCFIACHGRLGEDGTLQGFLKTLGIPFGGSGILASSVGMDKIVSKEIFAVLGLKTPPGIFLKKTGKIPRLRRFIPFVAKPSREGSTVGMSIVRSVRGISAAIEKAFRYDDRIIVEKYIEGREFTVGYLAGAVLPPLEIVPKNECYDYESKYVRGMSDHIVPAKIAARETRFLKSATQKICEFLRVRGAARVDFLRSSAGVYYVLELNTIPGMTPTSLLPEAASAVGIDFDGVVEKIISDCE
ncbi:MAG: D-alanine--D-alanine ligase [Elusimicrobia bacterium]|nr:D-alanine--D-alanine ligase [Elusimicrobiota bacterium]